ncbi:DUF6638 family protein [Agrobacterium sp. ES01]|uniref:DUF6638 family protein n=1 Tax=Agrobacterium sp. ES01 TaxID=3420714 RepID=UPI003D10C645
MNRLLAAELIYGRLLTIREPHLIERYNKALAGFGLRGTQLESFDIDMTGFSPQIADELGDKDYLDPDRVNRRFIIMTPDQENLPVVHTSFSNTAGLMHEFFDANVRAINAVTIKDALYGEIEDSVARVETLEDLLSINEVRFRVLSAEDLLGKAAELRQLADRLRSSDNAWRDDAMLNRMVELVKLTGDIRQNVLVPDKLVFRHDAYWANHFGGVFIFVDEKNTTVICDPEAPGFRRSRPWQVSYIGLDDPSRIFDFLARTGRIELPRASWVEASGLYRHRADMALTALAERSEPDTDMSKIDGIWLQTWAQRNAGLVAEEGSYPFLMDMQRAIARTGNIRMEEISARQRFMLIRAAPQHPDQWLTNRLIAQFNPADFVSRFIFDKQGFYQAYEGYRETYREFVVSRLTATYLQDKKRFRKQLYDIGDETNA